jgi:hypothetical protein
MTVKEMGAARRMLGGLLFGAEPILRKNLNPLSETVCLTRNPDHSGGEVEGGKEVGQPKSLA